MKLDIKKIIKIGACVVSGIIAFSSALDEKKKEDEINDMKKRLSKLEGKES